MSTVIPTVKATRVSTIQTTVAAYVRIPFDLYRNGEAGTFSDIRTYETSYYSDAGTTPAEIGDPIYQIDDQSGNGLNWVQATATARLLLKQDGSGLYLAGDGGDDSMTTDGSLAAGTYKFYIATREGIFIDTVEHAGGTVTFGPTTYTGGPAGILTALETSGELRLVGPPAIVPAAGMTAAKHAALVQFFQNRGAGAELELGPELVTNGTFDSSVSGWIERNAGTSISWASSAMEVVRGSVTAVASQIISEIGDSGVMFLASGKARRTASTGGYSLWVQDGGDSTFENTAVYNFSGGATFESGRCAGKTTASGTAYISGAVGSPSGTTVEFDDMSLKLIRPKGA